MYKNGKYYLLLSVRICLMYVYLCVMRLTLEEGLTIYSPPALFFFSSFFLSGDQLAHTNSPFSTRIGPQWLSGLR